jgi:hypothetical protein
MAASDRTEIYVVSGFKTEWCLEVLLGMLVMDLAQLAQDGASQSVVLHYVCCIM